MNRFFAYLFATGLLSSIALAAIPPKPNAPVGKILLGSGSTSGGMAGGGYSLLDVRRTADAKKAVERIVIDIGDINGNPHKGLPGYFHVELKKNPNKLVLDFSQTPMSRLDEGRLSDRFKSSLFVKNTSMILDPEDKALNISMDLKPGTNARVFQVKGQKGTSRVVVDLFPTKTKAKK